jgi:hypothetical protein
LFQFDTLRRAFWRAGLFVWKRRDGDDFGGQWIGSGVCFERGRFDRWVERDGGVRRRLHGGGERDGISGGLDSVVHLVGYGGGVGYERRNGPAGVPEFEERRGRDRDYIDGNLGQDAIERRYVGDWAAGGGAGDIEHGLHVGVVGDRWIVLLFVHGDQYVEARGVIDILSDAKSIVASGFGALPGEHVDRFD